MERLKEILGRDVFAARTGVELLEIRPGYARARMEVTPTTSMQVVYVRVGHSLPWPTWPLQPWRTATDS